MQYLQDVEGRTGASATHVQAFNNEVREGSIVCGGVWWTSRTVTLSSIAKTAGTATLGPITVLHNPTLDAAGNAASAAMWYAVVLAPGSLTITYTCSTATNISVAQSEGSDVDMNAPLKASALNPQANPGTGVDAITSGVVAPASVDGDYVWGYVVDASAIAVNFTQGTGFTLGVTRVNNQFSQYRVTAADRATGTWDSTTADSICGVMIFNKSRRTGIPGRIYRRQGFQ